MSYLLAERGEKAFCCSFSNGHLLGFCKSSIVRSKADCSRSNDWCFFRQVLICWNHKIIPAINERTDIAKSTFAAVFPVVSSSIQQLLQPEYISTVNNNESPIIINVFTVLATSGSEEKEIHFCKTDIW